MGLAASVCQPSTLRMLIWPDASRAQNSIAAVSAEGQHGLGLDPSLELLMEAFDRVCGARAPPLARWQASEGEQAIARFLQAVGGGALRSPHASPHRSCRCSRR